MNRRLKWKGKILSPDTICDIDVKVQVLVELRRHALAIDALKTAILRLNKAAKDKSIRAYPAGLALAQLIENELPAPLLGEKLEDYLREIAKSRYDECLKWMAYVEVILVHLHSAELDFLKALGKTGSFSVIFDAGIDFFGAWNHEPIKTLEVEDKVRQGR